MSGTEGGTTEIIRITGWSGKKLHLKFIINEPFDVRTENHMATFRQRDRFIH